MESTKIIRLKNLSSTSKKRIYDGQKESAKLWNFCVITHKESRDSKEKHPTTKLLSCLLYTSPSPRDRTRSRMPSSA